MLEHKTHQLGQVLARDGADLLCAPFWEPYHGQSLYESEDKLAEVAARPQDNIRAQRRDGGSVACQGLLDLKAPGQVWVERRISQGLGVGQMPADIDDLGQVVAAGGAREVVGADQIHVAKMPLGERSRRAHRVDQIDGEVSALERVEGLFSREKIAAAPGIITGVWGRLGRIWLSA